MDFSGVWAGTTIGTPQHSAPVAMYQPATIIPEMRAGMPNPAHGFHGSVVDTRAMNLHPHSAASSPMQGPAAAWGSPAMGWAGGADHKDAHLNDEARRYRRQSAPASLDIWQPKPSSGPLLNQAEMLRLLQILLRTRNQLHHYFDPEVLDTIFQSAYVSCIPGIHPAQLAFSGSPVPRCGI